MSRPWTQTAGILFGKPAIAGDKHIEINVCSPGGLDVAERLTGTNFANSRRRRPGAHAHVAMVLRLAADQRAARNTLNNAPQQRALRQGLSAPERQQHEVRIRDDLRPGDLGRIVALHGTIYPAEQGFGMRFEAYVARTVAEFVLDNDLGGRVWLAEDGDLLAGCSAIALRRDNVGQLRWVLVHPRHRGLGLGRRLVTRALDWCIGQGLEAVRLETTDGLPASMTLYRTLGFRTVREETVALWDGPRTLIRMEKRLAD